VPRLLLAVVATALVASLTACASPRDTLHDATDAGVSAVASSAIAAQLHASGDAITPATDTALSDALTELTDASRTVLELTPGATETEERRDTVEEALREATDTVVGARAALARGEGLGPWVNRLEAARDALEQAAP
jgi:hypothetical protein